MAGRAGAAAVRTRQKPQGTGPVGPFGKPVAVGSDGPAAANNFALTERQKPAEKGGEARSKNRSPKKPEKPKRRLAQAGPIGVRETVVFRTD